MSATNRPEETSPSVSANGTSSVTLSGYCNRWETGSTSEESASTQSSKPSTMDELIGSPRMSPISRETDSQSEDADFDQNTVISMNDEDTTLDDTNGPTNRSNNNKGVQETPMKKSVQTASTPCSEPSETESDALSIDGRAEVAHLTKTVKRLRKELETEKDSVILLRKKLTQTNRDKLGQTSQFNDEMSLLRCENVALQARLEEQTVHTEQLEFDLTKTHKKHRQDQLYAEQREAQDTRQLEDLKGRLAESQSKLSALEESYCSSKRESAEQLHKLKLELDSKDSQLANTVRTIEITKTENIKLAEFIKAQETTLKEMLGKIQTSESELVVVNAEMSKTAEELANQRSQTEQEAAMLQQAQEQCEIVTAQLQDEKSLNVQNQHTIDSLEDKSVVLECALNDEKAVSGELRSLTEQMRTQLHELEDRQLKQGRDLSDTAHSLTRSEQELSNLKKQLQMEKGDKRDVVNKLKKQLDVHQEHVKILRGEVSVTNKHQKYLEEISQKIVNDLQPVFSGFPSEFGQTTPDSPTPTLKMASEERTRTVFDTLYNTVSRYRKRLTSLAEEKQKAKAQCDSLTKESASYKEMLYEKETAYDDCKTRLTDAVREMDRVGRESTELEAKCATTTVDLETAKAHNETLQAQCRSLNQEILQMKGRYGRDSDEKNLYLQHIYHILTSDLDLSPTIQGQSGRTLSWSELSTTVSERLSAVLTELSHLRQQVSRLDETMCKNDSYMERLREEHSMKLDDVNQHLAAAVERHGLQWKSERTQLEEHYNNMMCENQNRQQIYKEQLEKSQRNAEEAWHKLKDSDETNRALEGERLEIHEKITMLEQRQRSLLCAVALIAGCYFPLLNRSRQLKEQRSVLMQQVNRFGAFKAQVSSLLQTVALELPMNPLSTPRGSTYARLKFRRVVIAVLAAHRLRKGSTRSTLCVKDEERMTTLLCWTTSDSCVAAIEDDYLAAAEGRLLQWLSHADLESVASLCTKDTVEAVDKLQNGLAQTGQLKSIVSSGLTKLMRQLSVLYTREALPVRSPTKHSYATTTLSFELLNGLQSSLSKLRAEDQLQVIPARSVATCLQERVLNFVQQLHSSETERKILRQAAEAGDEAAEQLREYQQSCGELERELYGAKRQIEGLVPIGKLEEVMSQLSQALEREKEAQSLLYDQSQQLKELSRRMENEVSDRNHSDQSAKFALKTLHDELDCKTTLTANLSRQVAALEGERKSLHDNIYDAEHALKTAANDRKTLSNYLETLTSTFNRCAADRGNTDLSRIMLSGELVPSGNSSPDLISVQRLAQGFVEAHAALQAKISALNTVTTEQLHEISHLKQEMSLVCTGQTHHPHNTASSQVYQYPSSGYGSSLSPLKANSDYSIRHSPAVLDMGLVTRDMPRSPYKSSPSHHQHGFDSQSGAVRPLYVSPRLSSSRGVPSPRLQMDGNLRR